MENITSTFSQLPTIKKVCINNYSFIKKNKIYSDTYEDVLSTFEYIYRRYGKGIYVKIINNKLENFIPFKNLNYKNTWQKKYTKEFSEGNIILEKNIVGLLDGYVVLDYNNDNEIYWIKYILEDLCLNRNLSDCEFFINSEKNLPLISNNNKLADFGIEKGMNIDNYINHRPHVVFSFNVSEKFKDFGFPMFSDYKRIINNIFGIEDFKSMKWEDKKKNFTFITNSTNNQGVFIDKEPLNQKFCLIIKLKSNDKYKDYINNIGIKVFDENPIIYNNIVYNINNEINENVKKLLKYKPQEDDNEHISKSKFIIIADDVGSTQDFSSLLFTGSCILKINSEWSCWFEDYMIPDFHYKIISEDLSDLEEVLDWCLNNDEECKKIGMNGREFAIKYLSKNGIYDYLQDSLNSIKQVKYNNKNFRIIQGEFQKNYLNEYFNVDLNDYFNVDFNVDFYNLENKNNFLDLYLLKKNTRFSYSENKAISLICANGMIDYVKDFLFIQEYENYIEGINDAFIGINSINKLCSEIPNFCYTIFCMSYDKLLVFKEPIPNNIPLLEFLNKNPKKIYEIFIQIFLSLQLAYERFCFDHGNLDPSNIVIKTLDTPQRIIYRLMDKTWAINTKYVAIIINYSNSIVLSNFNCYYKNSRMFIGNIEEIKSPDEINSLNERMLHSKGKESKKNLKYLIKKSSKQMYNNIVNIPFEDKQPIDIMKKSISKENIKSENIKFGLYNETVKDINSQNPRLIYDKIVKVDNPHENIYTRVFKNSLPKENTPLENIIIQYEILQSIKSGIIDLNLKFNIDLLTSERLKKCYEFVKQYYNEIIKETLNNNLDQNQDLYGIHCYIKKYIIYIIETFSNKQIRDQLILLASATIKDTIVFGIKNTIKFYEQFNKVSYEKHN